MSEFTRPLYHEMLERVTGLLGGYKDHAIEVLSIDKPLDFEYAIHLAKVVSKLSPMLGNVIEYRLAIDLNRKGGWPTGRWVRQDPGFPDTIFAGEVNPAPGIEIKTWFPLATEITARFKESITHFAEDHTNVAMVAWIPEDVIYGRPRIIDVWVDTARSVAMARDLHYHRPPGYLVFEPEDTTTRTRNLQQTNTNGYKFQGTPEQLGEAERIVAAWGEEARRYSFLPEYQKLITSLRSKFPYRLDTNFAKMDRIKHPTLEAFKRRVEGSYIRGHSVKQWKHVLKSAVDDEGPTPESARTLQELIA